MNPIRSMRLAGGPRHSLHCEIELLELPGDSTGHAVGHVLGYMIRQRTSHAGDAWRETQPLSREHADALFEQWVQARLVQGYTDPYHLPTAPSRTEPPLSPARSAGTPSPADQSLLSRLQAGFSAQPTGTLSRTIWRIGERRVAAAVPLLVDLIEKASPMQDYCVAWAIARCGDSGAALSMRALSTRGATDAVQRMARLAWLQLESGAARAKHAERLVADWPARLRDAWANSDAGAAADAIAAPDTWKLLSLPDWLDQLDQVALAQPFARRVLLDQLAVLPLRAGVFRGLRHIYKAAECRDDGIVFGLLHQRFETTPSTIPVSQTWVRVERQYVAFALAAARPDSPVAYSARTRDYLRRRSWRNLRRLGQDDDHAYVDMALGVLAAMDDRDAGRPCVKGGARQYDQYSHWMLFNRMLRAGGEWRPNRSGRSWHRPVNAAPPPITTARHEAFPALWDARPDALLWLLEHSRCAGVQVFAARALSDNQAYCAALAPTLLRALLCSPYPDTARFALRACVLRFGDQPLPGDWLLLLLQSRLPEARQYAIDQISRDPARHAGDALLVAALACAPEPGVRLPARMLCQVALAMPGQADAIVLQLLDWLACWSNAAPDAALIADLLWLLDHPLRAAAASAPYPALLSLLAHRLVEIGVLAGEWLLRHAEPVTAIPGASLAALLTSGDAALRSIGARLFGALPDTMLISQSAMFAVLCTDVDAGPRQAIGAVLQRIAPNHPAFGIALLPALLDALFRAETGAGLHADVLAWLAGSLQPALDQVDRATLLRLLDARSKGAQQLGSTLLPRFRADQFTVAEWAALARNENAGVRLWARQAFSADPAAARRQMADALRLFDSRWEDSRVFARDFFEAQCDGADWTPALLVSLCDHLDAQVQAFGRAMLSTWFDVTDVTEYMLKLSQHPSAAMQLFVSDWLERAVAADPSCMARLEPYFLSVLSQVNRGRIVKNRVLAFLRHRAHASEQDAALVARLYTRQVLTVAIHDKAHYIEGLRAIQQRYPALPATLTVRQPRGAAPLSTATETA